MCVLLLLLLLLCVVVVVVVCVCGAAAELASFFSFVFLLASAVERSFCCLSGCLSLSLSMTKSYAIFKAMIHFQSRS